MQFNWSAFKILGREGLFNLSDALTEKSIFFASSCFMCSLFLKLRAKDAITPSIVDPKILGVVG